MTDETPTPEEWAIDFDNESETNGCKRGFPTRRAAEEALAEMRDGGLGPDLGNAARARRCRRATLDDLGISADAIVELVLEQDDLQPSGGADVFARWDDQIVFLRDGASHDRITRMLVREFELDAWVLWDEGEARE